jgi:hypothetical protein
LFSRTNSSSTSVMMSQHAVSVLSDKTSILSHFQSLMIWLDLFTRRFLLRTRLRGSTSYSTALARLASLKRRRDLYIRYGTVGQHPFTKAAPGAQAQGTLQQCTLTPARPWYPYL